MDEANSNALVDPYVDVSTIIIDGNEYFQLDVEYGFEEGVFTNYSYNAETGVLSFAFELTDEGENSTNEVVTITIEGEVKVFTNTGGL